jgi:hypothetical protein
MKDLAREAEFIMVVLQSRGLSIEEACKVLTLAKTCWQSTAPDVTHTLELELHHRGNDGSLT